MLGETHQSDPAESAAGGWAARVLEAAVAPEHPVRAIWDLSYNLELPAFYGSVKPVVEMSDVLRFR